MKVLKKGPSRSWSKKYTCTGDGNNRPGCGAKLLVEESDLFRTGSTDMAGDTDYYVTFRCPICRAMTDIEDYPGDMWSLKAGPGGRRGR